MQVTSTTRRFHVHPVWLVAASIAVLLGVLVAGIAGTVTRDDSQPKRTPALSIVEPKTNDNVRFAEMNAFPERSTVPMRAIDRRQFIEKNHLPDAAPVVSFETMRFKEANAFPDDGAMLVAPFSDRSGERH
jgi:hypothetical protein